MKYSHEIIIDLPREKVIELFDNEENLKKWQDGLQSIEHMSGTPGEVGAQSKMFFDSNGRKIEMVETITKKDFPDQFFTTYETKGVWNEVRNFFYDENGKTKWVTKNEFTFSTLMMKMIGFFMPGAFKKQSLKYMQDFKAFAESQKA